MRVVEGVDIMLEEYAREHIYLEMQHIGEVGQDASQARRYRCV
jgi:hypothetical protein